MSPMIWTLLLVLTAVVSAVVFFFIGIGFRKKVAEREIGSAEEEATRILNDAIKSAEAKKREARNPEKPQRGGAGDQRATPGSE